MVGRRDWMNRHLKDPYVKQSKLDGYRSRAVYKLLEINDKEKLIKSGMHVIDLGAAPGAWSEWSRTAVGDRGQVIALDCLPMDPIQGVEFIQGDFRDQETLDELLQVLNGQSIDVIISDMAPNLSGLKSVDQPKSIYLAELSLELACQVLKKDGSLLMKVFQGAGLEALVKALRSYFVQVKHIKPKASRSESKELYLLAKSFKGSL